MAKDIEKNLPPDRSINKEPGQETNTSPSTGQHEPDIQDEKLKRKHGNRPQGRDDINPEEIPNGNPEEYNDGAPVEEKSPRVPNSLNVKTDFMKKINIAGMLVCAAAIFYSCSSPAHVEKDSSANLSNYKTYMWVDVKASENDASIRATAFADLSVHNSVNAELNKWGWQEVTDNPDVLVSYDVLVERNVETQNDPVYSQPYSRIYYNPYTRRWSTIYYPSQFLGYQQYQVPVREATVTITMMDADTDKRIWQGWTTERLSGGLSDLDVKKSVRNIFKESGNTAP